MGTLTALLSGRRNRAAGAGEADRDAVAAVGPAAHPLTGAAGDLDPLLDLIGDARIVLLGEASHGTHEFYRARAEISKRLIAEQGFSAVLVEADWPDAYRVNRYVRGLSAPDGEAPDETAEGALREFVRFPDWMWRNADVLDFVGWLRAHNDSRPGDRLKAGFYGMDLYSLYGSVDAVIRYLDRVDPAAAARARARYSCFEPFEKDSQAYGYAAHRGLAEPCEEDVVAQLVELQRTAAGRFERARRAEYPPGNADAADEAHFFAEQNARVAQNAERYYRAMFHAGDESWNLRDTHMVETLAALMDHLDRRAGRQGATRVAVWAHNSHLGDARATAAAARGQLNVGQLVRERWGRDAFLVGFSTYTGTVTAATDWGSPAERWRLRPGLPGSYEALLHGAGQERGAPDFLLPLREGAAPAAALAALRIPRLERFVGVIYRPETERWSHYYHADLTRQFDALLHFDESRAVEPLGPAPRWLREGPETQEAPETFPSAV